MIFYIFYRQYLYSRAQDYANGEGNVNHYSITLMRIQSFIQDNITIATPTIRLCRCASALQ